MFALCGCDFSSTPASLESRTEIPEDGIIPASVFHALQQGNKVITFCGESNGTAYEWTVFGSDIQTPQDMNLKIEVSDDEMNHMSFRMESDDDWDFAPILSLYSACRWDKDNAVVYDGEGEALCSASITGNDSSVLNFAVQHPGSFTIYAEDSPNTASSQDKREISDGSQSEQDEYLTDPVPEGKPMPVEPGEGPVDTSNAHSCVFSIECTSILNRIDELNPDKLDTLPSDGVLFPASTVTFYEGESVFDVLQRVCTENGIHMEASWTPIYNSAYVEGIGNLYEFDCGNGSGWMYRVNGWYPNYGCSRYALAQGDIVEWRFTCDLGADIGGGYAIGG